MNKLLMLLLILFWPLYEADAQNMNNDKLQAILYTVSDTLEGESGRWQFAIDSTVFICLTDEVHNRMRIISPIKSLEEVTADELLSCMHANFHTALDIKYAIADEVMWCIFVHPLKELSKEQAMDALRQVYSGANTYGTYYSSGDLVFPGN